MKYMLIAILLLPATLFAQTILVLQPDGVDGSNAYIRSNLPTVPIPEANDLTAYAWTCSGDLCTGRGFFKMPLEEIPSGAIINSATLELFANTSTGIGFGGAEPHTGNNAAFLYRVTEDWDAETLTWDTQPEISLENAIFLEQSIDPVQNYVLDAKLMLEDMIDNPESSYGFTLRLFDETDFYSSLIFASSNHIDGDLHPKLTVNYTLQNSIVDEVLTSFKIYPNPVSGNCNIYFREISKNKSVINICDIMGNSVFMDNIAAGVSEYALQTELLQSGLYFVYIENSGVSKLEIIK